MGDGCDVLAGLPDDCVDAVVTAPPMGRRTALPSTRKRLGEMWDQIERVLKRGASVTIIGPHPYRPSSRHAIWYAGSTPLGAATFMDTSPWEAEQKGYTFFHYDAPIDADPRAIAEEILQQRTRPHDLVLDPMARDGDVLLAATNLGRRYLGLEATKTRGNTANTRLQAFEQQRP